MLSRLLAHVRQQWMGALALFLVLTSGVAYAANTVVSSDIVDGEVKSVDVGNNQVRSVDVRDDRLTDGGLQSADLAPSSVGLGELDPAAFAAPDIAPTAGSGAFEIADNAVQGFEISDGVITGADVADNSLGAIDIGTAAVGSGEIADASVRSEELGGIYERMGNQVFPDGGTGENGDWGTGKSTASCNPTDELISAYAVWHGAEPGEELAISSLNMDIDTETAVAVGASDSWFDHGFEVFAVCLG